MRQMLLRLWQDDAGFVISTELVLVATILVLGVIVGLTEVRNAVVQELGDLAMAIGSINQSYSFTGVTGHTSSTAGSLFFDRTDFCEDELDDEDEEPGCINIQIAPIIETD